MNYLRFLREKQANPKEIELIPNTLAPAANPVTGLSESVELSGVVCSPGSLGVSGVVGTSGSLGTSGVVGSSGSLGVSGVVGTSGSLGVSGVVGSSGSVSTFAFSFK
ncbi:MAG TPA: hypothetical protein DCY20_05830 [Firmicutes bacterium]|nr:hypothetical protein [Bacillota bacterium]